MILDSIGFGVMGTKDYSKLSFWMPKLMLTRTRMWPENDTSTAKKIISACSITICIFIGIGLVEKLTGDIEGDFSETISLISFSTPISQTILKSILLLYHSRTIKLILNDIMEKFWPHDLFGTDDSLTKSMKGLHELLLRLMLAMLTSSIIYIMIVCVTPFFVDQRALPFPVEYYFDHLVSPIYEIMYTLHVMTMVFIMLPGILGVDFLMMAICGSIVGQYKILQNSFTIFNTDKMCEVNQKLRISHNDGLERKYDMEKEYLVRCIRHHQFLIRLLKQTNEVFSFLELAQLLSSALSLCISLVLTTGANMTTGQYISALNFMGTVLVQLILYCAIGNELSHQASSLPHYVFRSNWSTLTNTALKRDILFILMGSQQIKELTSYGLIKMDLILVMRVMRLSFSGYTFLSKLNDK